MDTLANLRAFVSVAESGSFSQAARQAGVATSVITKGRHDPCVGIRATPIAEAMLALVVMEHALAHRAQCADVRVDTPDIAG